MGNRKENLKKSLGLTEYPWSSDDDEDIQRPPVQDTVRRINREPESSVADQPGPSAAAPPPSEQASPATTRRIQARMDRDLFWSIINNTPHVNVQTTRPRVSDPSLNSTTRPVAQQPRTRVGVRIPEQRATARRVDRQPVSADVQRIVAFRKLTRNLNINRAPNVPSNRPANRPNVNSTPRVARPQERVSQPRPVAPAVPPRSTLFPTPTVNPRDSYNYRLPWRRSLPSFPTSTDVSSLDDVTVDQVQPVVNPWHYQPDPSQPIVVPNINAPSTSQMPEPFVNMVDHSEDELQAVPAVVPTNDLRHENNVNAAEDNTINEGVTAGSGEEVVEVVARDEVVSNPPPPGTEGEDEQADPPAENNNNNAETVNSQALDEAVVQAGPSYHGVKRKRNSTGEVTDIFSVHEFNQGLLRLLECPVCLEWMEPPITQCRRGHLVCGRCRTRLAACPVCRTPFSSVRNRAMEGVAEMLRYPCRHGCGREVRLRRRAPHEASCGARRYQCPAPVCARQPPLPHDELAHHFQCKHLPILKIGGKHKFSMKVNSEQHDTWVIMTLDQFFHLRVDVDIRTWGVIVYVAYIGPKRNAKFYNYEVTVEGQHNARRLVYTRSTHSDLESSSVNVSRQDCFHLTLDQALNFLRFKNRHCEPDKFLDFDVEITKWNSIDESREDSDS